MRLDRLLTGVEVLDVRGDPAATEITDLSHDSRSVAPGHLFCCLTGVRTDGHAFAPAAVASGAAALLVERFVGTSLPEVLVADTRLAMALAAANLHGHPARDLTMCGVTGTNGKTTTTHLLAAVLRASGCPTEVIGTLRPASVSGGPPNTPDAPDLQRLLARHRDSGVGCVAMEVSSHALDQRRVAGVRFRVAGFTNLTQDHLDYHGTMESYFQAKAMLFTPAMAEVGVVNADDAHGRRLLEASPIPVRPYSLADADDLQLGPAGSTFRWMGQRVTIGLGGRYNVANALCAATMAAELGIGVDAIAAGLAEAGPAPGRFERVDAGQPFTVLVDYAHTPDALEQVLRAAREVAPGRVIAVFGCGGDKDRGKRPLMGAIATELADVAVVTSDNPRSEDPEAIIADVLAGARLGDVVVEPDRRRAIAAAVERAGEGDVVVIAGKGHETGQVIGDRVLAFDDRQEASAALAAAGWGVAR